ncbi:hypothetical protein OS035_28470 [Rhizobium sp. 268]|uniref:hypothetical protein n=1 Tax=Rhizobium sp. 268 TaxID=2996375 RepID=UPI002F92CC50
MTDSSDLDLIANNVRAAAEECGTMILETSWSSEHLPAAAVGADIFPALVRHLKPRLIYMLLTEFDAIEEVGSHFEEADLDADLRKFAMKWTNRGGQSSRLILGVMANGIMHLAVETTDWFDEFEEEVDVLANVLADEGRAAFDREQEVERQRREADEKKRLAPIVKRLIADPRFVAPKISTAKRETLAEALFPDADRTTIKKAVEKAVSEIWLLGSER